MGRKAVSEVKGVILFLFLGVFRFAYDPLPDTVRRKARLTLYDLRFASYGFEFNQWESRSIPACGG